MNDDLLTTKDAAAVIGVARQRVEELAVQGELAAVRSTLTARTFFRHSDVERLRVERGIGRFGRT